jgi:CheY-like chemotaxis protein
MARVLIIDDDPQIRYCLRLILQADRHEVCTAKTGPAGLRCASAEDVDLIFCDLFMPGQGGLETIRVLRRDFPRIQLIAMSGGGQHGQTELLRVARGLGAAAVLPKPFSPVDVSSVVREVLEPSRGLPATEA